MVSLVGPTTGSVTEGSIGAGVVSDNDAVQNQDTGFQYYWLPGGYTVLSTPAIGNVAINFNAANGEGGYTWTYTVDSDDPALDTLDAGEGSDRRRIGTAGAASCISRQPALDDPDLPETDTIRAGADYRSLRTSRIRRRRDPGHKLV